MKVVTVRNALLLALIVLAGVPLFFILTAPRLHSAPAAIPSVIYAAPSTAWATTVANARQAVRASLAEQNVPGVSVAVGVGGAVVWSEGFGYADLATLAPVTPQHRFRIGSASTVLTSAAAGLLLESGRLKLDDEIQAYVPQFPKKQWPVTLRAVMGHTAGLVPDGGDEGPLFTAHCGRPVEALPHFSSNALLFKPGTDYRYSNYSWILVSAAIEAAARQPFLAFMQDRVFDPLGMRDTIADSAPPEDDDDFPLFNLFREKVYDPRTTRQELAAAGRATAYFPRLAANPRYGLHLMRPLDYSCYAGASVFVSTPSDLVRFGLAINGGKLLQPATARMLQSTLRLTSGQETGYGLGWEIGPAGMAGHNGDLLGGQAATLMTFPEQGMAVAVTSNISYTETAALAARIAQAFASARN